MRFLSEFRDPSVARRLIAQIRSTSTRQWTLMEVCGGQTHGLLRHGIDVELNGAVEMIHGPGCPVCVTSAEAIDFACHLSRRPKTIVASFGDMLRVPGTEESLLNARSDGGSIRIVYSPLDAVELARQSPDVEVVFFAVGFETTAPATAMAVLQAHQLGLRNFSLLVSHVRVQPAMEELMQSPDCRVQGFLAAGHVCAVLGFESYRRFVNRFRVPVVIAGFEPVDLLSGILECVQQLESSRPALSNQYSRVVQPKGNTAAQDLLEQVYEVNDQSWRGFGTIKDGGYRLKDKWSQFDASVRFRETVRLPEKASGTAATDECLSAEVLAGRIRPTDCPFFGNRCTPETPLGAPMVSSEGACAAYYHYSRHVLPIDTKV